MKIGFSRACFVMLILVSCTGPLLLPTEDDLRKSPNYGAKTDLTTVQKGHFLYKEKCGSCHFLYRPSKYSAEEWKKDMPEMSERSKLTSEEQALILNYLLVMRDVHDAQVLTGKQEHKQP